MSSGHSTRLPAVSSTLPEVKELKDMSDYDFIAEVPGTDELPSEKKQRGRKRKVSTKSKPDGQAAPKKFRGNRGKLEGMNDMPLDMWNEVCRPLFCSLLAQ